MRVRMKTYDIVADPKPDLSKWRGERRKCSPGSERIRLLSLRQLRHLALGTMVSVAYFESLLAGDVNVEQMDFAVFGD